MATLPFSPPSTSLTLNPLPKFLPRRAPLSLKKKGCRIVDEGGRGHRLTAGRVKAVEFSTAFFEDDELGGIDLDDEEEDGAAYDIFYDAHVSEKERPPCPPGLRHYETVTILRPDMSEDERLAIVQKYEELLVTGGGMYVDVFNEGVLPLDYEIKKKNREGMTNTYWDGIYHLFMYFTKPASIAVLESTFLTDDNVIRFKTFDKSKFKPFFKPRGRGTSKE